jgi:hypothetical protein
MLTGLFAPHSQSETTEMQQALVTELQQALREREAASAELVQRRSRFGAALIVGIMSSHQRHAAVRALAVWLRATTVLEAQHKASTGHEASLRTQLRRVSALAEQRGHQLAEARSAARAADDAAARGTRHSVSNPRQPRLARR